MSIPNIFYSILAATTPDEVTLQQSCELALDGADCLKYPYELCDPDTLLCVHKGVFPVLPSEIVAICLLPILLAFASVAGVGGGVVVVPIVIGFYQMAAKEAIAISAVIVLESAVIRFFFFSAWKEHPEIKGRTEIDYSLVRMVYPLFMIGSYVGVILYILFSELWICILVITIMSTLSIQMIYTSIKKFKAETIKLKAEEDEYQKA